MSFEGRRSGEGYFSRDGRRLIFQSEREPGNPFYQIYTLDLETGASQLVSPGVGKSTCGFFHPGGQLVLFSSTYLDPDSSKKQSEELDLRAEGTSRRYAWDYDEHYDIFSSVLDRPDDRTPKRLTREQGYDAEAAWSPNGREIVFASNRHAYASEAEVDPDRLSKDPSYYIDLYIMDASGRNVKRLTKSEGYDGGPFFSPDGERIVWRRFSPDGKQAEIHTMKKDGTDMVQLTHLDAISWAPFYHPSGEYIIFSTNLNGFDDFELYMVDVRGESKPIRVTDKPGFDGLPVFSPNGKELVWTSNRTTSKRSQLFRAEWNDVLARSLLGLPNHSGPPSRSLLPLPEDLDDRIQENDLKSHVGALTDPVTEGRLTGTAGERIASSYVARAFRSVGLKPAGDNGSYFQSFGFTAGISLGEGNHLEVLQTETGTSIQYVADKDWLPFSFSREGEVAPAEIIFAGYGIQAPASEGQRAIDDYAGMDVTGRWVLIFRYLPEELSPESRQHLHRYSSIRHKAMVAREEGARGLLVVSGPNSKVRNQLAPLKFDVSLAGTSIAALSITDALAEKLLEYSEWTLDTLQTQTDSDSNTPGFLIPGISLSANVSLERQRKTGRNVLGRLQVGPEPSTQLVVLGAHLDHLGSGGGSSSLADEKNRNEIHPGADDNASGVAAVLEIAQQQAMLLKEGRLPANRDILFAAWSGEELGLIGSDFWTDHAANPHDANARLSSRVIAYLNFDMVGRMQDSVSIYGVGSSSVWPREIEAANVSIGLAIQTHEESSLPTDATSFYNRQVPTLAAFTGAHTDYHTPTDTAEKLDYHGLMNIAQLMSRISVSLAARSDVPDFQEGEAIARGAQRAHLRAYLGTIPDYASSEVMGVLLSGVKKGGPADEAGLRAGDIIVELAGRKIENIYDYTFAIEALKIGESNTITVDRQGESMMFTVVPGSRE
ncbi:MAG: M28 family peptidase [Myxococcota bacterium]|nr:M28 family peptidase [Myxococcota bacterium]